MVPISSLLRSEKNPLADICHEYYKLHLYFDVISDTEEKFFKNFSKVTFRNCLRLKEVVDPSCRQIKKL